MRQLQIIKEEYTNCERCSLSEHRKLVNGQICFGELSGLGKIVFVDEAPIWSGESSGSAFAGTTGEFVRGVLDKIGLKDYYLTHSIMCRACDMVMDDSGQPMMRHGHIMYKDKDPPKDSQDACHVRLYKELYALEPFAVITFGTTATSAVLGKHVNINSCRGKPFHAYHDGKILRIKTPGKSNRFFRKSDDSYVVSNYVQQVPYLVMPTWHPATILKNIGDMKGRSDKNEFIDDIRYVTRAWRYYVELHNKETPA